MPDSDELRSTTADRLRDYRAWVETIHDPAEQASEGIRRLQTTNRSAIAEYVIAPLPDGRYAMRHHIAYRCGNSCGKGSPWQPYPSRDGCVNAFLSSATNHFETPLDHTASDLQRSAQSEILQLLQGTGLFGLLEPDPLSIEEAPVPSNAEMLRPAAED